MRELVADGTAFSVGRELVLGLEPVGTFDDVVARQQLTAEALLLDQMGLDVPFAAASDIRPTIAAAEKDVALTAGDLQSAAWCLATAARARRVLERVGDRVPGLNRIGERIGDFHTFVDAVATAIDDRAEVADSASEKLATVRRELRIAQQRLEQRASAALADAIRRGIAQEGLLTERNGRKVVPIKADSRGQFPGIVHDVSSSGATVFIEPMGVVDAGNEVRELFAAEEHEVRRILREITGHLAAAGDEARIAIEALAILDMHTALARFGRRIRAQVPPPGDHTSWLQRDGSTILVRARHPLLSDPVVPLDLEIGGQTLGVLITGPNTGGKTVALKTLGLLTLMVQAGMPVPCDEGSRFSVVGDVLADIGDEQSIEQSLSTFSAHMRNIIAILARADASTLVLLDELGAGTDPTEGALLARAIFETLVERECRVVATTHHSELKVFAHEHPRIQNASVEFDLETLSPTYHLVVGLPGQSNALAIARRLGLDEAVVARAEGGLGEHHYELETMLEEIRKERQAASEARAAEEVARREAEDIRVDLSRRRDAVESERTEILRSATREAEDQLARMRKEVDRVRRRDTAADVSEAAATLAALDADLEKLKHSARSKRKAPPMSHTAAEIEPGARLHVRDIPQVGEALTAVGEDGRVDAQFGALRMKVSVDRIERVESPDRRPSPGRIRVAPVVASELDVRGHRADEALESCDRYIEDAYQAGLPFVRIIHGKGTGALRAAIRDALADHPLVRRYESGPADAGGDGVTVAVLAGS